MKEKMKIFTIESGDIYEGVRVDSFTLKGAGVSIPAIIIGEEGRGRELGVLPVHLLPNSYKEWQENGYVYIHSAEVGTTKAGKPKLFQTEDVDTLEKSICIFRTKIGFRGSNSHTGDRKEISEKYVTPPEKKGVWRWDAGFEKRLEFHPFPGEILCEGIIAQGDAGRMGSGEQLVAILPADTVFRTGYSGRLYGQPAAHYYIFTDGQLLAATWEEREISDIF